MIRRVNYESTCTKLFYATVATAIVLCNSSTQTIRTNYDLGFTREIAQDVMELSNFESEPKVMRTINVNQVMYTSTVLNLRAEPSTDAEVLAKVGFSQEVFVKSQEEGSNWYSVEHNGVEGFVSSEYLVSEMPVELLSSTAYWNEYNRDSASGRDLVKGHSIAGKVEWLGRQAELYSYNEDGSVGEFLGTYTFDDTGYGAESGVGNSKILSGRSIGTIENGTCIDIYMDTYSECMEYGRRNIYVRFID